MLLRSIVALVLFGGCITLVVAIVVMLVVALFVALVVALFVPWEIRE